ncbi:MAG: hypoxanthine phosphoribosyltransferase [Firmicutes bacterium]|nr:hypoxanthine phosphoribosyltransferase [Bacillota bacterium]
MDIVDRILIDQASIEERIKELGEQISRDYEGKTITLVCILKGGLMFLCDLAKHITAPVIYDFMSVSSYGDSTQSSGVVRITKDLEDSIEGKHVLIVEDIIDTGLTLSYLLKNLWSRNPASLRICTLLDKPDNRKVEIPVDYVGFTVPNEFLVGYGLDYKQLYRNFPYIFVLNPKYYTNSEEENEEQE